MTGLSANTTYYVRAYATNAAGTNYGGVLSFKTDAVPAVTSVAVPASATYVASQNLDFTVNFNKAITVVTSGGTPSIALTLNTGGTVSATYLSGSGTSALVFRYTVVSGNADGDGVAVGSLSANGGTLKDAAGNSATLTLGSVGSTVNVLVDGIAPTVTSINRQTPASATTNATSVVYQIVFSESINNLDVTDFSLTTTGTATGTIASVADVSGTTKNVTVNAISGNGTMRLDLKSSGTGITDAAGNAISGGYAAGQTFTIDKTVPSVAITSTVASVTNSTSIPVTITFSESVSGFVVGDLTVTNGTPSGFTGTGTTYNVNIAPTGQGLVTVAIAAGVAQDAAGNLSTVATSLNRTFDNVAPTVTITSTSANPTNASTIPVTITFSESVTGFMSGDLTVINGIASGFTGTGTTYTVNITPSGQGLISVAVAAGVAQDAAGNLSTAATSLNRTFDNVAPTVTITSTAFSTTNVSPIPFTITFSESVTGFAVTDLSLINGTASGFTGSGTTYTVNIIPSDQGAVTVYVGENVAVDGAGNTNAVAAQLNRTFDTVAPTVSITSTSASVTNVSPIPVTITFNESVNYFDVTDLSLTNGTASDFNGSGSTYTVKITPSGQGAVVVNVAAGVATDGMGYANTAATPLTRTFDNVAPVISGVVNNGTYTSIQSPTFTEGTATLTKNGGTAVAYLSGTAINATGSYLVMVIDAAGNIATASFTITLSTGIDDERKPSLSVYPNPCTDGFKVSGIDAPANVTITDLTGRVVVTTMVDVDGDVPVNHLKQGTYLVKVNERVLKLIKK